MKGRRGGGTAKREYRGAEGCTSRPATRERAGRRARRNEVAVERRAAERGSLSLTTSFGASQRGPATTRARIKRGYRCTVQSQRKSTSYTDYSSSDLEPSRRAGLDSIRLLQHLLRPLSLLEPILILGKTLDQRRVIPLHLGVSLALSVGHLDVLALGWRGR